MQRYLTAAFLVLVCLLRVSPPASAQQSPMRFPVSGVHAFLITVQPDWITNEDKKHNGMQLFPSGRWGAIFLSIASDPRLVGRPLLDFAVEIHKAANIKASGKEEAAAISGRPGTAYYGVMTNAGGLTLDTRLVIVPMASDTIATLTTITPQSMTAAQQQAIERMVGNIALTK